MRTDEFWKGQGGDEYHARNWVKWAHRLQFWSRIINLAHPRSVHEFGCGPGWNLSAIQYLGSNIVVSGNDLNENALEIAAAAGLDVGVRLCHAELVFTAGCLIHIPPENIHHEMQTIVNHSFKYVLCIEYESVEEEEIEYRGQTGLLWKRPYRQMYEDLGLREIAFGRVGPEDGFDDCIWGLMSK